MVKIQGNKIVELCKEAGLDHRDVTSIRITPTEVFFTCLKRNEMGNIFTDSDTGQIAESIKVAPIEWQGMRSN